jgi:hypothetical protein
LEGEAMSEHAITAEFPDVVLADSAIGRLEVLGVPSHNIIKTSAEGTRVAVSASVHDQLLEKARQILQGDGTTTDFDIAR